MLNWDLNLKGPCRPRPPPLAKGLVRWRRACSSSAAGRVAESARLPDVFLGTSQPSPQYGALGQDAIGRTVALDLNETHTISLFGVQGGGKSYTLGSVIEAATLPAPPVNQLPRPLATIVFHYSPTLDYEPEFTSMVAPNSDSSQVDDLASRYGGAPAALDDVVILVPADQLEQRRLEHPELTRAAAEVRLERAARRSTGGSLWARSGTSPRTSGSCSGS